MRHGEEIKSLEEHLRSLGISLKEEEISDSTDMKKDIEELFLSKEVIDDSDVHALAAEKGYNKHELEDKIYEYAKMSVSVLRGGLSGDASKEKLDAIDPKQLAMGINVEIEHTDNKVLAEKIAKDHLVEMPDYYTRLAAMEKEAGSEKSSEVAEATGSYSAQQVVQDLETVKEWLKRKSERDIAEYVEEVIALVRSSFNAE